MTEVNIELNNSTNENKYEGDYNYEIELSSFQKFLVFFLNLLTGGLGTMLVPFLNKKRKAKTMIIAGIILGIMYFFLGYHTNFVPFSYCYLWLLLKKCMKEYVMMNFYQILFR